MTISDAEKVGDDAIASCAKKSFSPWIERRGNSERTATPNVGIEDLRLDAVRPDAPRIRMMRLHVVEQTPAVLVRDIGERLARYELNHAVDRASRKNAVRHELEVEVLLAKEPIHESEELDDELVLSEVVAVLEDDGVVGSIVAEEVEAEGEEVRLEDGRLVGVDADDGLASVQGERDGGEGAEARLGVVQSDAKAIDLLGASVLGVSEVLGEAGDARDKVDLSAQELPTIWLAVCLELRKKGISNRAGRKRTTATYLGHPPLKLLRDAQEHLADLLVFALDSDVPVEVVPEDWVAGASLDEKVLESREVVGHWRKSVHRGMARVADGGGGRLSWWRFKLEGLHELEEVEHEFLRPTNRQHETKSSEAIDSHRRPPSQAGVPRTPSLVDP